VIEVRDSDCLIIVDVQNDFCPGGALAVPGGDEIVAVVNALSPCFPLVVASRDAHPLGSRHFQRWPVHCVEGTRGADFHPDLETALIAQVFLKGTSGEDDGYSAFEATNVDLYQYLSQRAVKRLFVCGLATDYCVKATAADAVEKGFGTFLIEDAVRAVDAKPGDGVRALDELKARGVTVVSSRSIKAVHRQLQGGGRSRPR